MQCIIDASFFFADWFVAPLQLHATVTFVYKSSFGYNALIMLHNSPRPVFGENQVTGTCTSPITWLQSSKLHLDIGYVPPTDTGSLCLAVDSTRTAVHGLSRLLVRRSETYCQMNSEIRRVMSTASNSFFKTILVSFY